MEKIKDFFKTNVIVAKWIFCYFVGLWCILYFLFGFNMLSNQHWYKFFHATGFHGFSGFAFQIILYTSLPIFIATTLSVYRSKEPIINIPLDKVKEIINKLKPTKSETPAEETTESEEENESVNVYPEDLPHELRVPFIRVKNRMSMNGPVSIYNKKTQDNAKTSTPETIPENDNAFPIPTDFDIADDTTEDTFDLNTMPNFHDIDFDTPIMTEKQLENKTTKYLDDKKIEYETNKNFVATDTYLIYEHNDGDFWIMDEDSWFASGKQIDSPVAELLQTSKQNNLIPIMYLESLNIMDLENTISSFEDKGIRVIKSLDEIF